MLWSRAKNFLLEVDLVLATAAFAVTALALATAEFLERALTDRLALTDGTAEAIADQAIAAAA